YRHAGEPCAPAALLVHGYPESSYMWRHALPALADAGWWAIAPDLPGYGDSELEPPGTWERHVQALERFLAELAPGPVALVTHDWGVMIGLRWACEHPHALSALAISDGGFFSDRRWHDLANAMRTPHEGERLIDAYTREGFAAALRAVCGGIDEDALEEYWKAFATPARRRGQLELYRSGDMHKIAPYEPLLSALPVPALVLWGAQDRFASVRMAQRFHEQLEGAELVVLEDAGHFVWEDEPERTSRALVDFLERRVRRPSPSP
ncbi:MAG TPA: alpha/beta fold hydrolase, partial [Solirubrobacteraceae bacterium]|nr:alpha/beta fold hydrolase [Solirubrobacteraceae bacterium]